MEQITDWAARWGLSTTVDWKKCGSFHASRLGIIVPVSPHQPTGQQGGGLSTPVYWKKCGSFHASRLGSKVRVFTSQSTGHEMQVSRELGASLSTPVDWAAKCGSLWLEVHERPYFLAGSPQSRKHGQHNTVFTAQGLSCNSPVMQKLLVGASEIFMWSV
jgi:hypothetical protein